MNKTMNYDVKKSRHDVSRRRAEGINYITKGAEMDRVFPQPESVICRSDILPAAVI